MFFLLDGVEALSEWVYFQDLAGQLVQVFLLQDVEQEILFVDQTERLLQDLLLPVLHVSIEVLELSSLIVRLMGSIIHH